MSVKIKFYPRPYIFVFFVSFLAISDNFSSVIVRCDPCTNGLSLIKAKLYVGKKTNHPNGFRMQNYIKSVFIFLNWAKTDCKINVHLWEGMRKYSCCCDRWWATKKHEYVTYCLYSVAASLNVIYNSCSAIGMILNIYF